MRDPVSCRADSEVVRVAVGPSHRATFMGGERRTVSAGDVVVIPAGVLHGWVEIPDHVKYLSVRPDPDRVLPAGYVNPTIARRLPDSKGRYGRRVAPPVARSWVVPIWVAAALLSGLASGCAKTNETRRPSSSRNRARSRSVVRWSATRARRCTATTASWNTRSRPNVRAP